MTLCIRPETPADIAAICAVTTAAFLHAPHTDHTEQYIVQALRQAHALSVSLVAEHAGLIVGHVAASAVAISNNASDWYGLGPISVLPEWQRQGIGSALIQEALSHLRLLGAAGCVVLGDPAYYARFGFRTHANLLLPNVPPEYFQVLPFGSSVAHGTVTYHTAFNAQS